MTDTIKTFEEQLEDKIKEWTDEEILENVSKFLGRVQMSSRFGGTDEGVITHVMLVLEAGDNAIVSDPMEFEWPLQRMPMPDAIRDSLN